MPSLSINNGLFWGCGVTLDVVSLHSVYTEILHPFILGTLLCFLCFTLKWSGYDCFVYHHKTTTRPYGPDTENTTPL